MKETSGKKLLDAFFYVLIASKSYFYVQECK